MPTNRIDASAFRQDDDLLSIKIQDNDQVDPQFQPFEMTVLCGMTIEEMGQIVLDQPIVPIPDPEFDGTFELTWHRETDEIEGTDRCVLDSIMKL